MLTDLDKLYIAMAEVDSAYLFNMFCYSLNIKSLTALKDYDSRQSVLVDRHEIDLVKKKVANKDLDFKVLANKVINDLLQVKCNIIYMRLLSS